MNVFWVDEDVARKEHYEYLCGVYVWKVPYGVAMELVEKFVCCG